MPRSTIPIWILTVGLLIAHPLLSAFYWDQVLEAGVLPHDGDAIAIPIFGALLFTLMMAPLVIAITRYCLQGYNPESHLLAWQSDRPVRSLISTLVFGGMASALVALLVTDVRHMSEDYPWYEFVFTTLLPPAIAWSLAMRSALIEQTEPPTASGRDNTAPWGPREHRP